jgi:ribonuclease T2
MQCAPGRLYDFVLHGLWPQFEQGWPQDCSTDPIERSLVDSMLDIMPSPGLVRHEWSKHGTCSGLEPEKYFESARNAFRSINIPDQYKRPKLQVVSNPGEMRKRFAEANPKFQENSFAVACSGRFLQEVRVCLTTDFEPRACSKDVLRGQCKVDEMILRPVR